MSNFQYHCVHCMTPSESTYRTFGREIKLTNCAGCGQNVDPYVERDGLLVAMDCILLRDEAYRHVLCNNGNYNDHHLQENKEKGGGRTTSTLWRYSLLSALIQGFLLLQEALLQGQVDSNTNQQSLMFLTLLVQAQRQQLESWWKYPTMLTVYTGLGNWLFSLGIQWGYHMFVEQKSPLPPLQQKQQLQSRITLAVVLPTAFHVITILVMIWENNSMVLHLASVMVVYYQYRMAMVALQLQVIGGGQNNIAATATTAPITTTRQASFLLSFVAGIALQCLGLTIFHLGVYQILESDLKIPSMLGLESFSFSKTIGSILK